MQTVVDILSLLSFYFEETFSGKIELLKIKDLQTNTLITLNIHWDPYCQAMI